MRRDERLDKWDNNVLVIALLIVIIIIVFLLTAGKINLSNKIDNNLGSLEDIKRKHDRLKIHIEKQRILQKKLSKKFWWVYFITRLIFVSLWGVLIFILSKFHLAKDLGDFLNYFQAILILFIVLNFLAFGSITNLNNFLNNIKNRIENRVWGKHFNIDAKITAHEAELNQLSNQIENHKLNEN